MPPNRECEYKGRDLFLQEPNKNPGVEKYSN